MNNPAFTGSVEGDNLRLSYFNFLPGKSFNLHSFYVSYDSYFPVLHGGAGICVANDYMGSIVNDLRATVSYSYFLRASKDLYINAGLSAGLFRRGFNFRDAVFPDQISIMGDISGFTSEILPDMNRAVLDISTGFLFIWQHIFSGISISHLTEPDLHGRHNRDERLRRKYLINTAAEVETGNRYDIKARPLASLEIQGAFVSGSAGAVFESENLSAGILFIADNNKNIDIQPGFTIKAGSILFLYNYRLNLKSGESVLPLSVLHQTGIALNLNNVKKRLMVGTINLPRL